MADNRIAGLNAISDINPALDFLPIVDVSDNQMAGSGTTKKITISQILGAGTNVVVPAGTAGAPSISFSGDSNTGIYAPAADQLSISSGGSGNATVSSTGLSVTGSVSATSTITGTQLISTVAIGTAPLSITSTTVVSNLNADLLDGQHGTYYQDASNITAGTLAVTRGGTGILSYAIGDLIYASAATTLAKLASVASGSVLVSGGVATAPSWGKVELDIHVSKILPIANGGTGAATFTAGQILYGSGTSALGSSANLFWDSTNSRLGLGTATPNYKLEVVGATDSAGISLTTAYGAAAEKYAALRFTNSSFGGGHSEIRNVVNGSVSLGSSLTFWTAAGATGNIAERLRIASDGVCTWSNVGGVVSNAMVLNGTGLGVGVSPSYKLDVSSASNIAARISSSSNLNTGLNIVNTTASTWSLYSFGSNDASLANSFGIYHQSGTLGLLINQIGHCGIGITTPDYPLTILTPTSDTNVGFNLRAYTTGVDGARTVSSRYTTSNNGSWANSKYQASAHIWEGDGTERMRLTAGGNLGLGVTPKSWNGNYRAIQIGLAGAIFNDNFNEDLNVSSNAYYDSTDNRYEFIRTGYAQRYTQTNGGQHRWYTSTSAGNADTAITFTQAMTLDASGNLGIGTASPSVYGKLAVLSGATATTAYFDTTAATAYSSTSFFAGPNITIRTAANATWNGSGIRFASSSNGSLEGFFGWVQNASGYGDFVFQGYNGAYTERLRIDSAGNMGLGVTPKSWATYKSISVGGVGAAVFGLGSSQSGVAQGCYYNNGSGTGFAYSATSQAASYYLQINGEHRWTTVSGGTVDTQISSFTQAMTLDASGNLGLANVIPSAWLYNGFSVGSGTGNFGVTIYSGTANNGILAFADGSSSTARYSGYIQYAHGNDSMEFATQSTGRLSIKSTGQINFNGLASDPAGAAGDVYYNSASNKLKFYDSAWKTIPASDQVSVANGTAAAPSISFDSDTNTGIYRSGADTLQITTGGVAAVRVNPNGSFGYTVSVGGAVEQATSRTTGVTLSKACGAITLVSAAGSTSWQTFTVTNNTVDATDVVKVCQKSGTDLYQIFVTNVANGSFKISFATTGGTTTEQPVFNFAVIKAGTGDPV